MSPHRPRATRLRPVARAAALLVAGCALVVPIGLAPAASAHDAFTGSTPKSGSTLTTAPTSVTVSFEEPPLAAGLAVAVTAPDKSLVSSGDPVLTGSDVTVALEPLTASGAYTVAWRVVADDGHPVTGTFGFTLALGASATPSATATTTVTPALAATSSSAAADSSSALPWVLGGVAVLVLVGAGLGAARALRRRGG